MFSDLPQDIARTVFELAAEAGDGLSCALVSKQLASRVEPIIYRSICLSGHSVIDPLHRTLTDPNTSKPAEYFAKHIKFLAILTFAMRPEVINILRACTGVRVLVSWGPTFETDAMRELFSSSYLSPSRLSIVAEADLLPQGRRRHIDFSLPIFQGLTHLELLCASENEWKYWDGLSSLSNLTHLSVEPASSDTQHTERTRRILALCPTSLRIFVNWVPSWAFPIGGENEAHAIMINNGDVDPRAIMAWWGKPEGNEYMSRYEYALRYSSGSRLNEWLGKATGKDFWELAEEIVERRRKWLQKRRSES
ncbi:hypothetical protein EST38_g12780 [Candolleomyces aberdarensis]|uniref:F-box domain-containing protein n=1 Tax=Candolleomyces aberdarensis TaxID=2316362 RepID=A0A4Q2D3W4_9AGAR|nr:hypothetical protein EST38_g12780 [Candolleomyces aberdarensis]